MREWLERVAVCGEEDNDVFVWEEEVSGQGCGISASGLLPEALSELGELNAKKRGPVIVRLSALSFGTPPGARTLDPNIKSVVLYQLS